MMDLTQLIPVGGIAAIVGLIAAIVVLAGILAVWKRVKDRRSGFPVADERTQKVNGKAAYYALFIGVYFMLALLWIHFLGKTFFGFPGFEAGYALVASSLVFILWFLGLRWYFNRKVDF